LESQAAPHHPHHLGIIRIVWPLADFAVTRGLLFLLTDRQSVQQQLAPAAPGVVETSRMQSGGPRDSLWPAHQPVKGTPMKDTAALKSDHDTLLELNCDYIASVQASDVRRFGEILADDFLCTNPDGSLVDRKQFLEQTALPVRISRLVARDVNVRIMGDVALIHARTTYTKPDGSPGAGRYTDVWARRDGQWLAVSAHVTRC
jgi:ketosteroid isomerase-like protein